MLNELSGVHRSLKVIASNYLPPPFLSGTSSMNVSESDSLSMDAYKEHKISLFPSFRLNILSLLTFENVTAAHLLYICWFYSANA